MSQAAVWMSISQFISPTGLIFLQSDKVAALLAKYCMQPCYLQRCVSQVSGQLFQMGVCRAGSCNTTAQPIKTVLPPGDGIIIKQPLNKPLPTKKVTQHSSCSHATPEASSWGVSTAASWVMLSLSILTVETVAWIGPCKA